MEKSGIRVTALLPSATRTPLFDTAPNLKEGGQGAHLVRPVQEASQVGRAVVDAMEDYRPLVYPLRSSRAFVLLYDLLPGVADTAAERPAGGSPRQCAQLPPAGHRQRAAPDSPAGGGWQAQDAEDRADSRNV